MKIEVSCSQSYIRLRLVQNEYRRRPEVRQVKTIAAQMSPLQFNEITKAFNSTKSSAHKEKRGRKLLHRYGLIIL